MKASGHHLMLQGQWFIIKRKHMVKFSRRAKICIEQARVLPSLNFYGRVKELPHNKVLNPFTFHQPNKALELRNQKKQKILRHHHWHGRGERTAEPANY